MSAFTLRATVNGETSEAASFFTDTNDEAKSRKLAVTILRILADQLESGVDDAWWMKGWPTP